MATTESITNESKENLSVPPLIERAIDEKRAEIWTGIAVAESVADALETHFGRDWPANVPNYRRALLHAVWMIEEATSHLEAAVLEIRGEELRKEEAAAEALEVAHA